MRWFKHMSDMRNDNFIQSLMDEFGVEGYGVWCMILEIYADECGQNPDQKVSLFHRVLRKNLRISQTKLQRILSKLQANSKLFYNFCGEKIEIEIPKMALLKDDYSRKSGPCPDKVPANKKENKKEDKEEEQQQHDHNVEVVEKKIIQKKTFPSPLENAEALSAFYNMKPTAVSKFFTINRRGEQSTEQRWIVESLCAHLKRAPSDEPLHNFLALHPNCKTLYEDWAQYSIGERMAAYVFTIIDGGAPQSPLKYATSAIKNQGWRAPQWFSYLNQAKADEAKGELHVEI